MVKKEYTTNEISYIVNEYENGLSFSKIAKNLKRQKNNVKKILIDLGVWVEDKNKITKNFTNIEIEKIKNLYNNGYNCDKIGKIFGISKTPINRILKKIGVLKKGNSNGRKIQLNNSQVKLIKKLYLDDCKTKEEIAKELNLTKSFIDKYLSNVTYRRNKSEAVSVGLVKRYRNINYNEYLKIVDDYKKYKNDVMRITRQQQLEELENYNKRGNSGIEGMYHLDHKYSILEGFKNGISPKIIGDIKNLEFIPWEKNIKKRTKCSIKIEELNI